IEDFANATKAANEAISLAISLRSMAQLNGELPDEHGIAEALTTLGSLSQRDGNYSKAIDQFSQSLAIYDEVDNGSMQYASFIADKLLLIGGAYNLIGDNGKALLCLNRALNVSKSLLSSNVKASVLNNLGVLYLDQEDYEKAEDYLRQSVWIYQASNNHLETTRVSMNLAVTELRQGALDVAQRDFYQCAEAAK